MKTETKTKNLFVRATMVLLVMLLIGTIRSYAQNDWNPGTEGDWTYAYRAGVAKLVSYTGTAESITTPTTLGGNQVTIISTSFTAPNTTLKNLTISEGVVQIETGPFSAFSSLTTVSLPTSLVILGRRAFQDCSSLERIVVPANVQTIHERVFDGCTSLAAVTILGGVGSIETAAFAECSALKEISIPSSVTEIADNAFYLSGLENVYYRGSKAGWDNITVGTNAFSSWSNTNGSFTPTFHWYCMVTYDMQGHGTAPASQQVWSNYANLVTVPTAPTATGYDFGGWYRDAACTEAFDFTAAVADHVTIYAKWTEKMNTITFDLGGRGSAISNQTVYSGNMVTEPDVQFDGTDGIEGWYTDAGRTTPYDFTTAVDHSFTLYAKWAAAGTATITTNGEGGSATLTNAKGQTFTDGKVMPGIYTLTVTPDDGYSFSGKYTLTNRTSLISDMDNDIVGSAVKTYTLDLTEKNAVINVTFSSNPILTVTKRADDASVLSQVTYSVVNNQTTSTTYDNGDAIPFVTGESVAPDFGIRLTVDLGTLSGYAFTATVTDMGNNKTTKYNSQQGTSFLIQPYGSIDIDLYVYQIPSITLQDNADNSTTLAKNVGIAAGSITLAGRTLYKDGNWNTLCLPFAVSSFTGTPLEGATVMSLKTSKNGGSGFDAETGILTLNFTATTSITAGKAYIVKWETAGEDITDPVFTDVTISSTEPKASTSKDGKVSFTGCYSPVALTLNDKSNLFLGAANTLYYPNGANNADGNYYVNACRAYFHVDLTGATNVRQYVLNFGEEDEATGITPALPTSLRLEGSSYWYSLDGRRLSSKPTKRGVYINNGRKVVIK